VDKNTKIALGVVIGLVLLCCCLCVGGYAILQFGGAALFERMLVEDPGEASSLAQEMVDYDLPPGYTESNALNMGFFKLAMITKASDGTRPILMLLEMPSSMAVDEEQMLLQLQQAMAASMGRQGFTMTLVDRGQTTIRGQEVDLLLYEGTDEDGTAMKQLVTGFFDGKQGQVMVVAIGPEDGWSQTEVDAFLRSIN